MGITDADTRDRADMQRLVAGHDAALNDLMERHASGVFHFLYRMLGNTDDANDLAQETFVRVFQAKDRFRLNASFRAWLFTIAGNLARNHLRWRGRHPNISLETPTGVNTDATLASTLPAGDPEPAAAALTRERTAAVRTVVQELPVDLREALVLCEWEDLSVIEAAAVLRASPKAVESRLYRARKILREQLKTWL